MKQFKSALWIFFLLGLLAGCGNGDGVGLRNPPSCTTDADCVSLGTGAYCNAGFCDYH